MKKLFALLTVLVFCGAASATVVSLVDENTTLSAAPGGVVKLEITSDWELATINVIVGITGDGSFTGAMNLGDCGDYGWDATLSMDPIYGAGTVEIGGGGMANVPGLAGYVEVTYGSGEVIVSIVGDGTKGGTWDGEFAPASYSIGPVTIPEPMTIALLGLGSLFLLRRRK